MDAVKSTYLGILGIAILAWLQVTVVNTASFAALGLQNAKRRGHTGEVTEHQGKKPEVLPKAALGELLRHQRKDDFCDFGNHHTTLKKETILHLTWVDDHCAAAMAVLATEKALTRLPSGRTKSLKSQKSNHVALSQ